MEFIKEFPESICFLIIIIFWLFYMLDIIFDFDK